MHRNYHHTGTTTTAHFYCEAQQAPAIPKPNSKKKKKINEHTFPHLKTRKKANRKFKNLTEGVTRLAPESLTRKQLKRQLIAATSPTPLLTLRFLFEEEILCHNASSNPVEE